jgi:hypothetical protein
MVLFDYISNDRKVALVCNYDFKALFSFVNYIDLCWIAIFRQGSKFGTSKP